MNFDPNFLPDYYHIKFDDEYKTIYDIEEPHLYLMKFKNDAGNNYAKLSAHLFEYLNNKGIFTHFIALTPSHFAVIRALDILPINIIINKCKLQFEFKDSSFIISEMDESMIIKLSYQIYQLLEILFKNRDMILEEIVLQFSKDLDNKIILGGDFGPRSINISDLNYAIINYNLILNKLGVNYG